MFDQNAASPPLAYELAWMMPMLYTANAERDIRAHCERLKSGVQTVIYYPATPTQMAMAAVGWTDTALVLIGGCSSIEHGTQYLQGLQQRIDYNRRGGVNPFLDDYGEVVQTRMSVARILPAPRVLLVGHSMGGATAMAIARRLIDQGPSFAISVLTFGSPRSGPDVFANQVESIDICRWMNAEDPVPCVPPRSNQARLAHATLHPETALNWNRYVHTKGGLQLEDGGGALARDVPEIPDLEIQTSLAAWLYSCWLQVDSLHSMPTYIDRLRARAARFPVAIATPRPRNHSEAGIQNNSLREVKAAIAAQQAVIREDSRVLNSSPLVIPKQWVFATQKIGTVWCMTWQGEVVSIGPSRRKVRDQTRSANTLLRRLQRSASVGTDGFPLALKRYLEAAADPAGGFNPVMRVS